MKDYMTFRISNCIIDGVVTTILTYPTKNFFPTDTVEFRLETDYIGTRRHCWVDKVFQDGSFEATGLIDYTQPLTG